MQEPLPYLLAVKDYFKSQTKTWEYFANTVKKEEQLQSIKSDLLKKCMII